MTTQKQIRKSFWASRPDLETHALIWGIKSAPHNRHNTETRCAFVDHLNELLSVGEISPALAFRATL